MTRRIGKAWTWARTLAVVWLWSALSLAWPGVANAVLLEIDAASSWVSFGPTFTFCTIGPSGELVCPPNEPRLYTIAGSIELEARPYGDPELGLQVLTLSPVGIATTALDDGLVLNGLVGLLLNGGFTGSHDPCLFAVAPNTSCSGFVLFDPWTWSGGTWDEHTLLWTGSQLRDRGVFMYGIVARVAAIPEPGTLLLALPMLAFLWRRGAVLPVPGRRLHT